VQEIETDDESESDEEEFKDFLERVFRRPRPAIRDIDTDSDSSNRANRHLIRHERPSPFRPGSGLQIVINNNRNGEYRSIFYNGNNSFMRTGPSFADFDSIFSRIIQRIMEEGGGNRQKPATKETLKSLKSIKIMNKHYEKDENTGEMVPPN
jgi:hypothetical protein